jgi:hypothetical protein
VNLRVFKNNPLPQRGKGTLYGHSKVYGGEYKGFYGKICIGKAYIGKNITERI